MVILSFWLAIVSNGKRRMLSVSLESKRLLIALVSGALLLPSVLLSIGMTIARVNLNFTVENPQL